MQQVSNSVGKGKESQSAIITSLSETKDFNKIKIVKQGQRQYKKKPEMCQNACKPGLQTL